MKIILASSSPRRIEMLKNLNLNFDVVPSDFKEEINLNDPIELVKNFAYNKALDVKQKVNDEALIIAADTIVYKDGRVLGKPSDEEDAFNMLKFLSGDRHEVYTGICVMFRNDCIIDYSCTYVYFKELSDLQIKWYIETNEPFGKAGAYAIQGFGGLFVEKIDGCYFNVVGLPVSKLYDIINRMGINLF
ncbi:Maf family protein [Caloramator proteoclasticus]|uniref:dTTP/UTP pyrophosphatase n=1 Tax=Caloramator proteoclasticus DSM 10124 TaxID=1121262 RepID=A0A1M4THL2_9CLOT|nr:Maf family protein [Caloramator proteoclasticus]SHE43767.1 septum formation protein [Caloramator proteoclasticus DSM 10124]